MRKETINIVITEIEEIIKRDKLEGYENDLAFEKGLIVGLEAGIKYQRGDLNKQLMKIDDDKNDK